MTDHLLLKAPRGRPRQFDPDRALATGRALFHEHGYEALGIAAITEALGIRPASFYSAFGSKAAYFERIAEAYAAEVLPLKHYLRADRSMGESLHDLLISAAKTYTAHPDRAGCLILEALRSVPSGEGRLIAARIARDRRDALEAYVARHAADKAALITDVICVTMAGMSAAARDGLSTERLEAVAEIAMISLQPLITRQVNPGIS